MTEVSLRILGTQQRQGTWKYYGDEEEPKLHTGWFEAVPSKELNSDDHENGTTHWYYANSKGEITILLPTAKLESLKQLMENPTYSIRTERWSRD